MRKRENQEKKGDALLRLVERNTIKRTRGDWPFNLQKMAPLANALEGPWKPEASRAKPQGRSSARVATAAQHHQQCQ